MALNETDIYIIDRQGECFLINANETNKLVNEYDYNENVTGVARYGSLIFMTTTKGCIKVFEMKRSDNGNNSMVNDMREENLNAEIEANE